MANIGPLAWANQSTQRYGKERSKKEEFLQRKSEISKELQEEYAIAMGVGQKGRVAPVTPWALNQITTEGPLSGPFSPSIRPCTSHHPQVFSDYKAVSTYGASFQAPNLPPVLQSHLNFRKGRNDDPYAALVELEARRERRRGKAAWQAELDVKRTEMQLKLASTQRAPEPPRKPMTKADEEALLYAATIAQNEPTEEDLKESAKPRSTTKKWVEEAREPVRKFIKPQNPVSFYPGYERLPCQLSATAQLRTMRRFTNSHIDRDPEKFYTQRLSSTRVNKHSGWK